MIRIENEDVHIDGNPFLICFQTGLIVTDVMEKLYKTEYNVLMDKSIIGALILGAQDNPTFVNDKSLDMFCEEIIGAINVARSYYAKVEEEHDKTR